MSDDTLIEEATAAPEAAATDTKEKEKKPKRKPAPKGSLEAEVKRITDAYITGAITPPENVPMTPHRIARFVMAERHLSGGPVDVSVKVTEERGTQLTELALGGWKPGSTDIDIVSAGAVTAMLLRWETIGFVTLHAKPTSFEGYTEAAMTEGLSALKAAGRAAKGEIRKANKANKAALKEQEAPEPEPEIVTLEEEPELVLPKGDWSPEVGEQDTEPVSDPAYAPPAGYSYTTPVPQPQGDMAGASDPVSGAPGVIQSSPFGN